MRTDTQRLDYVLTIVEQQDEEAADKLGAAYTLGFRGRVMVDAAMGARIIEPGQPMPELTALDLVGAELGRIRNVKGFSEERDDKYVPESGGFIAPMVMAALAYLQRAPSYWPWDPDSFKPSPDDRKKELTKGIALAVCELDRLIRAERREVIGAGHECEAQVCAEMNAAACEPVTVGIDLASGPDQRVVDGVLQPQPREFKIGDRVRIVSNARNNPWGWCAAMDVEVGTFGTVVRLVDEETDEPGYEVNGLIYPAPQLEHVDG